MTNIEYRKISEIKRLDGNPRKISKEQMDILKESIKKNTDYFEARPIILSDRTGELVIIAGNQRYEACRQLGIETVPTVLLSGLTEEREREIIIRDNVNNGEWDDELLKDWDADLLADWGVDVPEWDEPEKPKGVKDDNYDEPEDIDTDIKMGDLFEIRNNGITHRLQCGDSCNKDDVNRLLDGEKADMIFTDPPYDLEDNYSSNIFDAAKDDCNVFIMNSSRIIIDNVNNGIQWFRKFFAVDFRNAILVSNKQPMTRMDLIAEFCKGKGKFRNLNDGFSTLIQCAKIHSDKVGQNFGHKQAKKVELPATFIEHYSDEGDLVVDLFGGSGTTLVAAAQLGRICYTQEFEPKYCQVIINRFLNSFPDAEIVKIKS